MNNNKQSKICLTAFYFGKFNNYFKLWLNSCKFNNSIDFILFTDVKEEYDYPPNVKRRLYTFDEFSDIFKKHFDFPISLKDAYHVCDYVPAFGDIFHEEFLDYDFWGHCDMDLIFGDIRSFIPENILFLYDKISWRGHFSLYKNNPEINKVYQSEYYNTKLYKTIFSNPTNSLFAFEENEINNILEEKGYKIYKGLYFADLKTCTNNFEMMHFSKSFQKKNKDQIFEFSNGKLLRHFVIEDKLETEEMMYIHFLKRPMDIERSFGNQDHYIIVPNRFINCEDINIKKIKKWNKKRFYYAYYFKRLNWEYFKKRKAGINSLNEFKSHYNSLKRIEFNVIIDEY
ncbi:DUF6625 family protein [Carboxylicivirga sp. RSCT41]|uniref:DUF6625 family protein n=1 Tax=Carboxylicivirga agarovorans TaxID=3417570 RepID=UPI003D33F221